MFIFHRLVSKILNFHCQYVNFRVGKELFGKCEIPKGENFDIKIGI